MTASLLGCSSADFGIGTTPSDASHEDTGLVVDSNVEDSTMVDTSEVDTGEVDTGEDVVTIDTGHVTKDTGPKPDTGTVIDTGTKPDTGNAMDTSTPESGPACPMPPTTATFDASTFTCADLPAKYDGAIAGAKACACDADCSKSVAKNFCGCTTWVNPGTDAYAELGPLHDRWTTLMCRIPCPATPCVITTGAHCLANSTGGKSCQDG